MPIILTVVFGSSILGLFMLVRAAFSAPEGEEDERGFRFSEPQQSGHAHQLFREMTAAELAFFRSTLAE